MDVKIVDFSCDHFLPLRANPVQQHPHTKKHLGLVQDITVGRSTKRFDTTQKKGKIVGWSKKLMSDTPPHQLLKWNGPYNNIFLEKLEVDSNERYINEQLYRRQGILIGINNYLQLDKSTSLKGTRVPIMC